jgi:hypothetical protein
MTTRETVAAFKELYGAEVSAAWISKVTDAVIVQVVEYPKGINGNLARGMPSIQSYTWTALW